MNHPHVGQVYEVGEDDGELFLTMELVEGEAVEQVESPARYRAPEALDITVAILAGAIDPAFTTLWIERGFTGLVEDARDNCVTADAAYVAAEGDHLLALSPANQPPKSV